MSEENIIISTNTENSQEFDIIPPTNEEILSEACDIYSTEPDDESMKSEDVDTLRAELETLKAEFEEKKRAYEKISREFGEFSEIFPTTDIKSLPDSVWEEVKSGIPLAAAYALYEKKCAIRAEAANNANLKNSALSSGSIGREVTENFYTPDEVRAMSRAEVKKNYSKIIESMKKWN
jgi:hypothetical protein